MQTGDPIVTHRFRPLLATVRALATVAALGAMGCALIETLRIAGPQNIPYVGPYVFVACALAAAAVAAIAHEIDLVLSRRSRRESEAAALGGRRRS